MQEIEVGEYVRTRSGIIGKIYDEDGIDKNGVYTDTEYINEYCNKTVYISNEDIAKHSKNIIDLLEVGDYVNGEYVESVNYGTKDLWTFANYHTYDSWHRIVESEIETIVTHEQFGSIEYKI